MNKEATEVDPDGAGISLGRLAVDSDGAGISLGRLAVTLRMGWWAGAEKGALRGKQEPDKYLISEASFVQTGFFGRTHSNVVFLLMSAAEEKQGSKRSYGKHLGSQKRGYLPE